MQQQNQPSEEEKARISSAERSRIAKLQNAKGLDLQVSQFTSLLRSGCQTGNFDSFFEYFKSLSPAKTDLEIRSLDPRVQHDHNELADFVKALTARLKTRQDFELVNTWMAVFLRIHSDVIGGKIQPGSANNANPGGLDLTLQEVLGEWKTEQEKEGRRLAELVGYCRGIVGFLRSTRS